VGIGGVASMPEYRRNGAIRAIFNEIFRIAPSRGWATSVLYPFSFSYYRQFGYERIMELNQLKVSASVLSHFERNTSAKLYCRGGNVSKADVLSVYNTYAKRYNVMFPRTENSHEYSDEPNKSQKMTYVWYDKAGKPSALATIRTGGGVMNITELCYISPDALRGILGFLRMFEGQVYEFCFRELPPHSELELLLREYVNVEHSVYNGAMGRVVLPQTLLENNIYPEEQWLFRVHIDDFIEYNRGVYDVAYEHGTADVKKLPFDSDYDISLSVPPLSRIMLGSDSFDADRAAYLDGVKLNNPAYDFFRAFPKRSVHLLEKF